MQKGARDASTGGQVSELQAFLTDYFDLDENIVVGGYFGKLTQTYLIKFQDREGLPAFGIAGSLTRAKIAQVCGGTTTPPTPVAGIRVTAPNGGERWEMGVLNTVTWTPYQYNPDINPAKDVTANLEVKYRDGSYTTVGKVQESGKASIHWITGELDSATQGGKFADPNHTYYIRVVNNVTGAWDRSDESFTLLPKPVDLKVNGSDGPITATAGVPLRASWTANGATVCHLDNAYDAPEPSVYPIPTAWYFR